MRGQDPCPARPEEPSAVPKPPPVSALCPDPSAGLPRGSRQSGLRPRAAPPPPHDGPSSLLAAPGAVEPPPRPARCSHTASCRTAPRRPAAPRAPQQPSQPPPSQPPPSLPRSAFHPRPRLGWVPRAPTAGTQLIPTHTARGSRCAGDTREGRAERPLVLTRGPEPPEGRRLSGEPSPTSAGEAVPGARAFLPPTRDGERLGGQRRRRPSAPGRGPRSALMRQQ